MVFLEIISFS